MPAGDAFVPADSSILCHHCGYTLDGLPAEGNCPECGVPVAESTTREGRELPAWEAPTPAEPASEPRQTPDAGPLTRFLATTLAVTFHPGRFYRTLATRQPSGRALNFARAHWVLSAILMGLALSVHIEWNQRYLVMRTPVVRFWWFWPPAALAVYLALSWTTHLATRLTAWEAAYRGYRLPRDVVLRGLYYHAAHYLPVGLLVAATTAGNLLLLRWHLLSPTTSARYLLVLCVEVFLAAGYLFKTYWAGMRGMMYANR